MLLNAMSRTDDHEQRKDEENGDSEFRRIQHWNFLLSRRSMARISPLSVS